MRHLSICIILCLAAVVNGQQPPGNRFVILPADQGMLVVASQPTCPLKFEDPRLLVNMKGVWFKDFALRNQGTKPIRAYMVAAVGTTEWSWEAPDAKHMIMPGQLAPPDDSEAAEIIPLTDELRARLKLQGPMKGIVMLMVVRVEYDDGTVFRDKNYNAAKGYFEKLYASVN